MLLVHHHGAGEGSSAELPSRPRHPAIPHDAINSVLIRYLGHGRPPYDPNREPYSDLLARSPFGPPERLLLPGRPDLIRSVDDVIDNYLSMSFAAPERFGERLEEFRADLAEILAWHTDTGRFWEWPGDTEVLIARKSSGG